jgi:hypothetical protein
VIEDFISWGKLFKEYKQLKEFSMRDAQEFKNTYPTYLMPSKQITAIDVEQELEILKQKYEELNYGVDQRENVEDQLIKPLKIFPNDKIQRIPQIRKIYVPRWMSKSLAEYDIDDESMGWQLSEWKTDLAFYPFWSFVYLPNYQVLWMGGLSNKIPKRSTFSSRVVKINIVNLNLK